MGYTESEANSIIEALENGFFSYMPLRHEYSVKNSTKVNGIDVPTMWHSDDSDDSAKSKTIMLLAQDPLRSDKYWALDGSQTIPEDERKSSVIIGSPYALHVTRDEIKKHLSLNVGIYRRLIKTLISQLNCRVYCTDIFKYYPNNKSITTFDIQLLKEEINAIHPDMCICMGRFAQKAFERLNDDISHICCPHPRAWPRSWDKWRNNNGLQTLGDYSEDAKINDILQIIENKL